MGFTPGILKAVQDLGFDNPLPVQEKVMPLMLDGTRDIIALAQTGTGKTAAFGLPLVQATDSSLPVTQALILCPTRELCIQITGDLNNFAKYMGELRILAVYGGASIETQIRELKKGVHIIVATPGRLIDLLGRKAARLSNVTSLILDEADEMLNMGFVDSINEILSHVPQGRRTLLFSATMSPGVAAIARDYMTDPVEITIGTKNSAAESVTHGYFLVHAKDKYKVLKRIADSEPDIYGIVFCRTRQETRDVAAKLLEDGYNADSLHGDLSQSQRDAVMQKFRQRSLSLLVATDVAARGLDVNDLTHVINYTLPDDPEVYTHRCGRTGRAGKTGVSLSIVHLREKNALRQISRMVNRPFDRLEIPTGSEICGKQLFNWVRKLENVNTIHREIERLLPEIQERVASLGRDELLKRVLSLEFDRFLDDYRNGEDIFSPAEKTEKESRGKDWKESRSSSRRKDRKEDHDGNGGHKAWSNHEGESGSYGRNGKNGKNGKSGKNSRSYHQSDSTRLFINLGKSDGFYPEQLIDLLNSRTKGKKIPVGKIDLMKNFSFFEVEKEFSGPVIKALNNSRFGGTRVVVEPAQDR